jgi:fibronectin type 3 domain-containing protein
MPRTLDRQEATRRLAIRATHDDDRSLTYGKLAGLFHASYTTIREALGRTVREWRAVVENAGKPF